MLRRAVGSRRCRCTLSARRYTFSSAFGAVDPRIAPACRRGASSLCAKSVSDCARLRAVIADFPNDISGREIPCCSNCLPVRSLGSGPSSRDSPQCKELSHPLPRRLPAARRTRPAAKLARALVALRLVAPGPKSAAVRTAVARCARFARVRALAVACAQFARVKATVARWERSATVRAAAVNRDSAVPTPSAVPTRSAAPPLGSRR